MDQSCQALPASDVAHPVLPSFNLKELLNSNASLIYSELTGVVTIIIVHLVVLLASCHVAAGVPRLVLMDLAHDLVLHVCHLHLVTDIIVAQRRQAARLFNSAQKTKGSVFLLCPEVIRGTSFTYGFIDFCGSSFLLS